METYTVAENEAQANLTSLVDRAAAGEQVVVTGDGSPVAELRRVSPEEATSPTAPRSLFELRNQCRP